MSDKSREMMAIKLGDVLLNNTLKQVGELKSSLSEAVATLKEIEKESRPSGTDWGNSAINSIATKFFTDHPELRNK
jgi:hypothetical protein